MAAPGVTVFVCVSCRDGGDADMRPGALLLEALRTRLNERNLDIAVEPVECLAVCKRPATVAFAGGGKWTYVIGDLDGGVHVDELIDFGAKLRRDGQWHRRLEGQAGVLQEGRRVAHAAASLGRFAQNSKCSSRFPSKKSVSFFGTGSKRYFAARARSIASRISARASAASPQPATLAHLPGSRSL